MSAGNRRKDHTKKAGEFGRVFGAEYVLPRRKRDRPPDFWKNVARWSWRPFSPEMLAGGNRFRGLNFAAETNYHPSRRAQKVILWFGRAPEIRALRASRLKYFYIDYDLQDMARRGTIDIRFEKEVCAALTLERARLNLRDVAAVVWAPPTWLMYQEIQRPSRECPALDLYLAVHRWGQFLRDLHGLVPPGTVWLPSHPLNGSQEWQNRIGEFQLARRAGLRTPPTLCTNRPQVAIDFINRHGGQALFREFSVPPWNGPVKLMTAREVRSSAKALRRSPCTFMKRVDKKYDVRAVVIGDRVFAVRIDSQASPLEDARLDWRLYDNAHVRWERMDLPNNLKDSMFRLMRMLGLAWGTFDFVIGKDRMFYFLEVNRPGASGWLLPFVGIDVAAEVVSYLKRIRRLVPQKD